jgi:GTP-binding protein Era
MGKEDRVIPIGEDGRGPHRSGYVAIIGRPNVGKSTLLNGFLGCKLAIVSPRPQTTRHRMLGVKTLPQAQLIFVDTPGIHPAQGPFNRYMVREALRGLGDADLVLLLVEAGARPHREDGYILEQLRGARAPVILVINKIDSVQKPVLLGLMDAFRGLHPFEALVPVCALTGDGVDALEKEILARLPAGPPYFPQEQLTDRPERFLAAELVREKVFRLCGQEIPYAAAVVVEEFQERDPPEPVFIRATILVEKASQKGILIGAKGRMLKRIGSSARADLQRLLDRPVYLELWVRVQRNWSKDEGTLGRLGYR